MSDTEREYGTNDTKQVIILVITQLIKTVDHAVDHIVNQCGDR